MLHLSYNHLIAFLHLALAERTGHQIDSLGCATGKDDFFNFTGIDKATHFFTGSLVQIGSLLTQIVYATMHIGIHIEIFVAHGIKHHKRFLGGSRIIQIHQRLLIYLAPQDREIFTYFIYIVHKGIYLHSLQPEHLFSSPRKRFSTK